MKQYLLFVGSTYYARGGWSDLCGDFDSVADAEAFVISNPRYKDEKDDDDHLSSEIDWAQVVDTHNMTMVWRFYERFNETTRRCEKVWGE